MDVRTAADETGTAGCPVCREENPARAKFCLECGAPLRAPGAEARKTVSVVFSDLVGSTRLQAALDVESVRHVMGRFYAAMRAALEAHGGRVEKFIGDAVMGVFGTPIVREDDALRAVRAAAAMREALAALNDELERDWGVRLGMRTGINTGEIVTSREGFLVGDTVNVAARLEQAAADGEVLVGEATWRLTRHDVGLEPVAPLVLKGKDEPVAAYRLLAAATPAGERGRIDAPLVGRDGELARLHAAFEAAVDARACRMVSIIGSPGLGKTRLAHDFAEAVAGRASVVEGRCEPSGEGSTFLPVAEVLRDAGGVGEADEPRLVREKLAGLLPAGPDRDLLVERAAGILGLGEAGAAQETFWSVRRLLGGLARARPLVVVLDDVHWGQPTFLDLVEHLAEWGREAPMLLLVLARPELRETRATLTRPGRLVHDVLELSPLAPAHSRRLVDELVGWAELPEALARRVLETTEGNPLFVGETLRMLVDDGVLRRDGDAWVAAGDAATIDVPPTISALLAARIERLGAAERSVVERAAVIGKQFSRGAVAELAPPPVRARLDEHLDALHRKEVVEPDGTLWIDEPVFRFHHVLIRDAAYRSLLKEARAELHERFADWLETKAGDLVGEQEEVIAFHLEQAHDYRRQLGPLDERGRALGARAVERLHSAGRRALAREDLPAAGNLLRRAAAALPPDAGGQGDLLVDLVEALLSAGDTGEAAAAIERLRAVAGDDARLGARASVAAGQLANLTDTTHLRDTVVRLEEAAGALAAAGDDAGLAKAHQVRAQTLALLGQVAAVEAALDQALAAARRAGDARRVTAVLSGAPRAALWGPSPVVRASGRCLDVVRILRMTPGNRHVEAVALRCQAVLEAMRGRAGPARQILDRCRATLEELGLGYELLETALHGGLVELLAGDPAAAEDQLRRAHDGFVALGVETGAASAAALLARALLDQGRDTEALTLTDTGEEGAGEDLKTSIVASGVRAEALARRGEQAAAETLARRAVALAAGTDALADHADARMALARVLREGGREADAAAEARRARELYEAKAHEIGIARAVAFVQERPASPAPVLPAVDAGVASSPAAGLIQAVVDAINRRDWAVVRRGLADGLVGIEHRPASPLSDLASADAWVDRVRAYVAVADDVEVHYTHDVDAGRLHRFRLVWSGHANDTGGAFANPLLLVARLGDDGRFDRFETFAPEDERGAVDCLLGLQPDPAVRTAWRHALDVMLAVNAGDDAALRACWPDDLVVVDRRTTSWGELRGGTALLDAIRSSLRAGPQVRVAVELVHAAGADVVMGRTHWTAGDASLTLGQVVALRDGVAVRLELFDPDDAAAMDVRFGALCSGEFDGVVETARGLVWQRLVGAANARDWNTLEALLADALVLHDHRPASPLGDIEGAAIWVDRLRAIAAAARDVRFTYVDRFDTGDVGLAAGGWSGDTHDSGGAFEIPMLVVHRVVGGRIDRVEIFPSDDEATALRCIGELTEKGLAVALAARLLAARVDGDDEALRRLVAPGVAVDALPGGRTPVTVPAANDRACALRAAGEVVVLGCADGRVTRLERFPAQEQQAALARVEGVGALHESERERLRRRTRDAINRRDWATAEACYTDDFTLVDRRRASALGDQPTRRAHIERMQALVADAADLRISYATLFDADRTSLLAMAWSGHADDSGGAFEIPLLNVQRIRDGRFEHFELFDPEDEDAALRRLAELAAERGEEALAAAARWVAGYNGGRLERLREVIAPDVEIVDHRPAGTFGDVRGLDRALDMLGRYLDVVPDRRLRATVLAHAEHAYVASHVSAGHDERGGAAEVAFILACAVEGGLHTRMELFAPGDEDAALRRFAELEGDEAGESLRRQLARRVVAALDDRDWAAAAACLAGDFVLMDHRPAPVVGELHGPQAWLDRVRALVAASHDMRCEVVELFETPEIGLVDARWTGHATDTGGAFEIPFLNLHTVRDGRLDRFEVFDPADERAALRRLADLAEADGEEAIAGMARLIAAYNGGDLEEVREVLSPHVETLDHRRAPTWNGVAGAAGVIDMMSGFRELMPDRRARGELLDRNERAYAARVAIEGHGPGGGTAELAVILLGAVEAGVHTRIELFETGDEAGARARLEELRVPGRRLDVRCLDAMNARDWATVAACLADDLVVADHRRASPYGDLRGASAYVERLQALVTSAPDVRLSYARLFDAGGVSLVENVWSGHAQEGGGAFEVAFLNVLHTGGGRLARFEVFDIEDESEALRRAAALSGEEAAVSLAARLAAACRDGDAGATRRLLSPEVAPDHLDRLPELLTHRPLTVIAANDRACALRTATLGGDAAILVLAADRGRATCLAVYGDATGDALERVAELGRAPAPDVASQRVRRRCVQAINDRDWPGLASSLWKDFVLIDHRPASPHAELQGADAWIARVRSLVEEAGDVFGTYEGRFDSDVVSLFVFRWEGHLTDTGGAFEIPLLDVNCVRDERFTQFDIFPADDREPAMRRLAELALDQDEAAIAAAARWVAACDSGDREQVRALLAPDAEVLDRRSTGSPIPLRADRLLDHLAAGPDPGMRATVVRRSRDAYVLRAVVADEDGADRPFLLVCALEDGLHARIELFAAEDEAHALARFDELAVAAPVAAGPTRQAVERLCAAMNARDWEATRGCLAGDFEMVDHRRVSPFGPHLPGPEGYLERVRSLVAVASDAQVRAEPVGELGDVYFGTQGWSGHQDDGGGPFELCWRGVGVLPGGRLARYEIFDEDDELGMLRAAARLAGGQGAALGAVAAYLEAHNAHDWTGLQALLAPDVAIVDHRPAGWGELSGATALPDLHRALAELAADSRITVEAVLNCRGDVVLYRQGAGGHSGDGGPFELAALVLGAWRDGTFHRVEIFPVEDETAARRRFEELTTRPA